MGWVGVGCDWEGLDGTGWDVGLGVEGGVGVGVGLGVGLGVGVRVRVDGVG